MTRTECLSLMKTPGAARHKVPRGAVIQIKTTNACDLDCRCCTAAVGLGRKHHRIWRMEPEQFRMALRSLDGFDGIIGMFGGNPCVHPQFDDLCDIFRAEVPNKEQRGLWSNRLFGKGAIARETFHGPSSNLNVHRSQEAFDEFIRDWPECKSRLIGIPNPSHHGSWWTAMRDLIPDEGERWQLISKCFVNQTWSSEITVIGGELRAFFCEWAATRAEYADVLSEPATGLPVEPGWWRQPMSYFADQIDHHCHRCGAPLNPRKVEDLGQEAEDYTETNAPVFITIKGRPSQLVTRREEVETGKAATLYL